MASPPAAAAPAAPAALVPAPLAPPAAAAAAAAASAAVRRRDEVMTFASSLAQQPCPLGCPMPALWAMLTGVSYNATTRPQGTHILLQNSDHVLGRTVKEQSCHFENANVSGRHCTISRRFVGPEGRIMPPGHVPNAATDRLVGCIKDTSSNGTYVNFQRLQRNGNEVLLRHGDVISLVGTPENDGAYSFVYREVTGAAAALPPAFIPPGEVAGPSNKRKGSPDDGGEPVGGDGKRIKGLGNAGPNMLNEVRSLQRSNEELRVLVEAHVLEVEKLRSEYRSAEARHASELKEVRAAVAEKFSAQQEELKLSLATKESEAEASAALRLQLESNIELLQQRLASEAKSRVDAEEVIDGLKSRAGELEKFLEEERAKISKERAEAEASLKAALDRIRMEAAEELKRHEETALRQQEQQNEIILALQEGEKESRAAAEISRKKLDSERAAVVAAEERARRLESQLQEEKALSLSAHHRGDDFEVKLRQTSRELEEEKVARETAQARIARLEVEMEAASRDLKLEKQRLQGARERIVLRETQLRAFHSTAAEIADLQQRQQDQLLTMIRTLEDGDSDNELEHTNVRSTSPSTKAQQYYSEHHQGTNKRVQKATSQSTSGSRAIHAGKARNMATKSKGTVTDDDDTEGDTQQEDGCCSNASRSSDVNILPTQVPSQTDYCGTMKIPSTYDDHAWDLDRVQFTSGATQQENGGDVGFTQIANTVDMGCTQLLNDEAANLEGGANQGLSTGQDGIPAVHRDEAEPMEEETPDPRQWDDGADEVCRGISLATLRPSPLFRFDTHNLTDQRRDSLCTADLLASEVAGSWAFPTPASAPGENNNNDSSSAEHTPNNINNNNHGGHNPRMDPPPRRTSDEGAADTPFAASQVATNNLPGDGNNNNNNNTHTKTRASVAAGGGGDGGEIDMSQTTPKKGCEVQRVQEGGTIVNGMLSVKALGRFGNSVGAHERGLLAAQSAEDTSDDDDESTQDGSREDGEIGASELRDSEPVSPLMYAQ